MSYFEKKSRHPDHKGGGVNPYGQPDHKIRFFFTGSLMNLKFLSLHLSVSPKIIIVTVSVYWFRHNLEHDGLLHEHGRVGISCEGSWRGQVIIGMIIFFSTQQCIISIYFQQIRSAWVWWVCHPECQVKEKICKTHWFGTIRCPLPTKQWNSACSGHPFFKYSLSPTPDIKEVELRYCLWLWATFISNYLVSLHLFLGFSLMKMKKRSNLNWKRRSGCMTRSVWLTSSIFEKIFRAAMDTSPLKT